MACCARFGCLAPRCRSCPLTFRCDGTACSTPGNGSRRTGGSAVYFTHKGRQMCFACDRWDKMEDNLHAVSKTIEALRGIERWGTGEMVQQAFTGFVALPGNSPWEVLGLNPG